jgi:hypothetical protein
MSRNFCNSLVGRLVTSILKGTGPSSLRFCSALKDLTSVGLKFWNFFSESLAKEMVQFYKEELHIKVSFTMVELALTKLRMWGNTL